MSGRNRIRLSFPKIFSPRILIFSLAFLLFSLIIFSQVNLKKITLFHYAVENPDPYGNLSLYWGDFHGHTILSDGKETPEKYYDYAKNTSHLDFSAITDHAFRIRNYPQDWDKIINVANSYNSPGNFVTLIGFEWSGKGDPDGHKNIYYRDSGPLITSNRLALNKIDPSAPPQPTTLPEAKTAPDLFNAIGNNALAIPHHALAKHCDGSGLETAPMSTDWSHFSNKQRLAEIYSKWGSSEHWGLGLSRPSGCYVLGRSIQDALSMGHKLGFVGGGDSHLSKPGSLNLPETPSSGPMFPNSGLTAVFAPQLSREAIFDALWTRRVYATSGVRIILKFSADGHLMGEEISSSISPTFRVQVQPSTGATLEFVKVIKGWKGRPAPFSPMEFENCKNVTTCSFEWKDASFSKSSFYYIRVKQTDGNFAWSSPIWVNKI